MLILPAIKNVTCLKSTRLLNGGCLYKLVAFDAYGTLFDVYSMAELAEELFPGNGQALSVMWRDRQIDYTRLITMSDPDAKGSKHYLSFWEITIRALRYVCKRLQLSLTQEQEKRLMDQYAKLVAFDDSQDVLKEIKGRQKSTAILSNGSRQMLATVVKSNGLKPYLDKIVTVEDIKLFKTSPQSYQLLVDTFKCDREEILFVSSNAWDAVGASWFGFDVFWINRQGLPFEEIGNRPKFEGKSLTDILQLI
jgi:2-haloacid dehalogenase